ncbi:MAG: hypothetical protein ABII07_05865 [Patescibacteria group bacterium]|nr:hypothetical protein [Patescibacteria group bacterium]
MSDFLSQLEAFTCISDDYREKLLKIADKLPENVQNKILSALKKGEEKKIKTTKAHNRNVAETIKRHLEGLKEFKRGPLRKMKKKMEEVDHASDERAAEDLLKDL